MPILRRIRFILGGTAIRADSRNEEEWFSLNPQNFSYPERMRKDIVMRENKHQ
jgi:hypothetical protein